MQKKLEAQIAVTKKDEMLVNEQKSALQKEESEVNALRKKLKFVETFCVYFVCFCIVLYSHQWIGVVE